MSYNFKEIVLTITNLLLKSTEVKTTQEMFLQQKYKEFKEYNKGVRAFASKYSKVNRCEIINI